MARLLRLLAFLVVIFVLLLEISLLAGRFVETVAITTYQDFNGYRSTTHVVDDQRNLQLDLAGRRCFKPLPAWVWEDIKLLGDFDWEGSKYQPRITPITIRDDQLSLTVERLSCRRIETGKLPRLPVSVSQSIGRVAFSCRSRQYQPRRVVAAA